MIKRQEYKKTRQRNQEDEGRRMPQGRNEEIRKGGIGIGKKRKKQKEKEEGDERTEDNRGIAYVDTRCRVREPVEREEGVELNEETRRTEESTRGRGKKTTKQLEKRRRPHFMLPGIGSL